MISKRALNEAEVCQNYIGPAIETAGWSKHTQIRREYSFTAGRITVRGKLASRGRKKRADYLLFYQSNPALAVVEAKDNKHAVGAGMQQALACAETLDVPYVFSTNGDAFLFHDRTGQSLGSQSNPVEQHLSLDEFPCYVARQMRPRVASAPSLPQHQLAKKEGTEPNANKFA